MCAVVTYGEYKIYLGFLCLSVCLSLSLSACLSLSLFVSLIVCIIILRRLRTVNYHEQIRFSAQHLSCDQALCRRKILVQPLSFPVCLCAWQYLLIYSTRKDAIETLQSRQKKRCLRAYAKCADSDRPEHLHSVIKGNGHLFEAALKGVASFRG